MASMPTIERITPERAALFKLVRLRALLDAPTAFGGTYERESKLSDEAWIERAVAFKGEQRVGYLAMDQQLPCGIIGAYLGEADPQIAHVIMMWVTPSYRRSGVGGSLVNAIRAWAGHRCVRELQLMVTSVNLGAIRFYEKIGFTMGGVTEPYQNDPDIVEYQMIQTLRDGEPGRNGSGPEPGNRA
jgi:ribosomal protein S18 acetylase RimI-like enzyme